MRLLVASRFIGCLFFILYDIAVFIFIFALKGNDASERCTKLAAVSPVPELEELSCVSTKQQWFLLSVMTF